MVLKVIPVYVRCMKAILVNIAKKQQRFSITVSANIPFFSPYIFLDFICFLRVMKHKCHEAVVIREGP